MSYRITKGQLIVECDTQAEFAHVYKVLTDLNVPIPSTYGGVVTEKGAGWITSGHGGSAGGGGMFKGDD